MGLVSTRDASLEKIRYLFTAGQFLDPERVERSEHIRQWGGGEEIQTYCLRRSVGGFLPRARVMPLEIWAEALPPELIGEGLEHDTVTIAGAQPSVTAGGITNKPGFLIGKSLRHVKYYPGDEIKSVLRTNDGKGIVEIKALFDQPWYKDESRGEPGIPQLLNFDFFPSLPPIELNKLEEQIDRASGRSELHGKVAQDMQQSCAQFRRWAETRLSVEHAMLRERKSHLYVHSYSPVARELLRQLEMTPQDRIIEGMAGGISADQLREIIATVGGGQMTPEIVGQIAGVVANQILAAQAQAVVPPAAEQQDAPPMVSQPMGSTVSDLPTTAFDSQPVKNKGGRPRKNPDETQGDTERS